MVVLVHERGVSRACILLGVDSFSVSIALFWLALQHREISLQVNDGVDNLVWCNTNKSVLVILHLKQPIELEAQMTIVLHLNWLAKNDTIWDQRSPWLAKTQQKKRFEKEKQRVCALQYLNKKEITPVPNAGEFPSNPSVQSQPAKTNSTYLDGHLRSQLLHGDGFEIIDSVNDVFQLGNSSKDSAFHLNRLNSANM